MSRIGFEPPSRADSVLRAAIECECSGPANEHSKTSLDRFQATERLPCRHCNYRISWIFRHYALLARGPSRRQDASCSYGPPLSAAALLVTCDAEAPRTSPTEAPPLHSAVADAASRDASAEPTAPVLVGAVDRPHSLSVLVFSRTVGFRHDSIADAHEFFQDLDSAEQLSIEARWAAAASIQRAQC